MDDIIHWLIDVEARAARLYRKASLHFPEDVEFTQFLEHLSRDEEAHHAVISKAAELAKDKSRLPAPVIKLDMDIRANVEGHLLLTERRLEVNNITKDTMMECIVYNEFSEWNDIFLYVIASLKQQYGEFMQVALRLQQHKQYIAKFIASHAEFTRHLKDLEHLPRLWEEKILVVDDEDMIVDLLSAIFADEGVVDSASNGRQALEKTMGKYYAAIITDVDMPEMNGVEFYNKAVEKYPSIRERFLFFTGSSDEKLLTFFKENHLSYLTKPTPINQMKKKLTDILSRQTT